MINDILAIFSGASAASSTNLAPQAILGAAPVLSTNVMDLGAGQPTDVGTGQDTYVMFNITQAATGTATGLTVQLVIADDPTLTVNQTPVGGATVGVAALTAGSQFAIRWLRPRGSVPRRYAGIVFTPVGGSFTTLALHAALTVGVQDGKVVTGAGFNVI